LSQGKIKESGIGGLRREKTEERREKGEKRYLKGWVGFPPALFSVPETLPSADFD
jgi:hypothetical protein